MRSAMFTAEQAFKLEKRSSKQAASKSKIYQDIIRSYVINTIFSSVAFLESFINEVFQDITDNEENSLTKDFTEDQKDILKKLLNIDKVTYFRILEKYETLLNIARKPSMDFGIKPYQDIILIVLLRNKLIHYKPKNSIIFPIDKRNNEFEKKFQGKFEHNIYHKNNVFFPEACLGSGCALWTVKNIRSFYLKIIEQFNVLDSFGEKDFKQFNKINNYKL